jgi:hypothetical protein
VEQLKGTLLGNFCEEKNTNRYKYTKSYKCVSRQHPSLLFKVYHKAVVVVVSYFIEWGVCPIHFCRKSIYPAVFAGQWPIYKHITIVNYVSSIVNKLGASLTDNASVIIYDRHMFIVQATGGSQ